MCPVFFGLRLFGKVDQRPGLFHVATEFFYLKFVPIAPARSYLILEEENTKVRIGLSGQAVSFAYARAILGCSASSRGCSRSFDRVECSMAISTGRSL
jgi:hypothetical protein